MGQYYEQGSGMCETPKSGSHCEDYLRNELPVENSQDCNSMTDESLKYETKGRGLEYSVSMPDSNARQKKGKSDK